ncbi:MAG TPA: hypothetical protein VHD62_09650 [Opitutaceae bacterium]|nr:hypothetical protein [Opitutaceae bacterium]
MNTQKTRLHVCIDDHSRFSHAAVRPDERQHTAVDFLEQVVARYRSSASSSSA